MRHLSKIRDSLSGKKPSVMLYLGVGTIALLKDLLDFVGIGSFPGIGFVVTACFTFLIWILLHTFDNSISKEKIQMLRGIVLVGVAGVEGLLLGVNFIPIETMAIFLLYKLAHSAWKKAEKREKDVQKKTKELREFGPMGAMFQMRQTAEQEEIEREATARLLEEQGQGQQMRAEINRERMQAKQAREDETRGMTADKMSRRITDDMRVASIQAGRF